MAKIFLLQYSKRRNEVVPDGRSAIQQAMNMTPNIPVYDESNDGGYAGAAWTNPDYSPAAAGHDAANPVAYLNRVKNMNYIKRFMGSAYGEYQIIKGLTFRSTFGITTTDDNYRNLTLKTLMGAKELPNTTLGEGNTWTYSWNWDQTLNYNKQIGKHDFNAYGDLFF